MKAGLFVMLFLPVFAFAQTKKPATKVGSLLQASTERGKAVYTKFCLTCHQVDGSGVPNMNPPLTKNKWTMGPKPVLIHQVLKGSHGTVEIDGDTFHNTMPPMAQLTDQQIADVLSYVRNSFGNKASMVTPAEVKLVRAKTK
jgi:mono/diheme cytochrome c family protein